MSNLDGRSGAQGTYYAVDLTGSYNTLNVRVEDSPTWQIRGIVVRAGSIANEITSYSYSNIVDPYDDSGTQTTINPGSGVGAAIPSTNPLLIPWNGSIFHVSGTGNFTQIAGPGNFPRTITLIFDDVLTCITANGLVVNGGTFTSKAGSTLTLAGDGTYWREVSRSAN